MRENREIPDCPPTRRGAGRSGKAMPYARDERLWEVRQPHSTCEAAEQGRESGCGGGGGKGAGRGEHGQQDAPRTQGRNWCVTCAGSCAPGRAWPNPTLDPSQEPSAVVPHAGICAGGRPKGRSLPRLYLRRSDRREGHESHLTDASVERVNVDYCNIGALRPVLVPPTGSSHRSRRTRRLVPCWGGCDRGAVKCRNPP
jgi:hypothetical protein